MPIKRNPCTTTSKTNSKVATNGSRDVSLSARTSASGEARFHRSEDSSLTSDHILTYLRTVLSPPTTNGNGVGNKGVPGSSSTLRVLSCEETVDDDAIQKMNELFQQNHQRVTLQILRLARNQLTSAAGAPLANIIKITQTLTYLDISHNKLGAEGLEKLVQPLITQHEQCSLRGLNLEDNALRAKAASSLKKLLENNTTLEEIHLGHNPLTTKGIGEALSGLQLNKSSKISYLDVQSTTLAKGKNSAAMTKLIELFLRGNERIHTLDLSSNNLKAVGVKPFLMQVFRNRNNLTDLNLGRNEIGADGLSAVAKVLPESGEIHGFCLLQRLTLDWNQIGDDGAEKLAEALEKNSSLHFLDLSSNNIGSPGACRLAESFAINFSLKRVLLDGNNIDNAGARELALALRGKNCTIEELSCHENPHITEEGEFFLNHAFVFRESMKTWLGQLLKDLESNRLMSVDWWRRPSESYEGIITDWEVEALVEALARHNPQMLQTIFLTGERITDQSLSLLCSSYLAKNPSLQRLYLKNVCIQDRMKAIRQSLCTNSTLRILSVTSCSLSALDAANLAMALKHNNTLERLNLNGNNLGDEGFCALWEVINPSTDGSTGSNTKNKPHPSLVSINVGSNALTDGCMAVIGGGSSSSIRGLQELYLDKNQITDRGALDLAKVVMDSETLKRLSVANNQLSHKGINALRWFAPALFDC